jgi:hypothetical protein
MAKEFVERRHSAGHDSKNKMGQDRIKDGYKWHLVPEGQQTAV